MKTTFKTKHTLTFLVFVCMITSLFPSVPKSAEAASIFIVTSGNIKVTEFELPKRCAISLSLKNKKGNFLKNIKTSVKDTKIVDVDGNFVIGKKIGSTQAVLTYKNKKYTCKINVVPAYKIKVISAKRSKNSMTFKVKNNMKKAITFYSEGAFGDGESGIDPATLNKKTITIQPKKAASFVASFETSGVYYDGICLRTEYAGSKFTYFLSPAEVLTGWRYPVWLDYFKNK